MILGRAAERARLDALLTRARSRTWVRPPGPPARAELTALGDRPVAQPHDRDPLARLSPRERQVVRLAAAGLSNREIAAQLFLSHRTVEHHLHRSYPKLGVTGRRGLSDRWA